MTSGEHLVVLGEQSFNNVSPAAGARRTWPSVSVIGLSVLGMLAAGFAAQSQRVMVSVIAYAVVLLIGSSLVLIQRVSDAMLSRSVMGRQGTQLRSLDKIALGSLIGSCLANGINVAVEVAHRWPIG